MYSWDIITSETAKISIESHGEAVFTDVNETILVGDNQARWFWELLQNAKDAIDDNQTVNVRLLITDDEVVFMHDGNTFELAEILKLITQGSSKKGKEGKTGRFGTGFISTYILSRQVRIQGKLDDQTPFNFLLDREAGTAPDFLIKQQDSTKDFYSSFGKDNSESLNGFSTSFTYRLSDTGKLASTSGLEEVEEYLPYVLAFNPKFKNISVLVNGVEMSYEREEPVKYIGYEHPLEEIGIRSMIGETPGRQSVVKVIGKNWESGFKIVQDKSGNKFTSMNAQTPNLFASFPLLGTEVLGLPFAVNSIEFGIKHERNGVFLGSGTNDIITKNKNTVKEAIAALNSVLSWSLKQAVGHRFNIITFYNRDVPKWLDGPWLTDLKREAIAAVTTIPMVTTHESEGEPVAIADLLIPGEDDASTRVAMFKLLTDFAPKSIPVKEEAEQWYEFAVNAEDFPDENQEVQKKRFLMIDFCGLIQAQINLATLQNTLGSISAIEWLNELYVLAGGQDLSLFHKHCIVPVRNQDLVKIDASIKTDKIMDDTLYAVSDLLGNKLFPTLVEPGIELPSGLCSAYLKEDLVNKLIGENANQSVTAFVKPELIEANALMLKWLITNKRDGLINAYQVITAGEDQSKNIVFNKLSLGTFADKKQKLLAPKSAWRSAFKLFEKLVRDRDCLHETYAAVFDDGDLKSLADSAFIHLTPLIKGVMQLTKTVAPQLLKDPEQESLLMNEDGSSKLLEIPYSDFAFFTRSDNQIFANNTTTQSSIEILHFVLQEGVAVDESYNQFSTLTLDTGQQIEVRKALWVGRLKNNQWVNVKNTSGETNQSYSGERPSSQNLSGLINSANYLKTLIKDEKATILLNLLGVSVSDLLKNTLGTEAEKMAWERAFTALLSANLDPELAEVMLKDKNLQQEYRKRQQNTLIINRNQEIGSLLESEFRKLFLRPEFSHLDIERKPFGSDFIISPESSDLVDEDGNKIIFRIGSWYLELKATGREYAAMTKLQAQRAVENSMYYALVVLPLDNFPINGDNILQHVRFVKNIGEILTKKYCEVTSLKTQQNLVVLPTDEVQVAIDEEDIRYNIQASVWTKGIKMLDFINDLNKLSQLIDQSNRQSDD